ncbi:hypothetical protein U2F10_08310 [Leptothoe sp. EHU-05/26/07-4]
MIKVDARNEYRELCRRIENKDVESFICEIALSLESISRKDRPDFWESYIPQMEMSGRFENNQYSGVFSISPDTSKHPGMHPILQRKLAEAQRLGFKVLRMTNLGTVMCPDIPDSMYTVFSEGSFWNYCERVAKCSDYIVSHDWGRAQYEILKNEYNLVGLSVIDCLSKVPPGKSKAFCDAIAEWVDGDSISMHFGYSNEYFCTEDRGKGAGKKSVFHEENLASLKQAFGLKIVSISELLEAL